MLRHSSTLLAALALLAFPGRLRAAPPLADGGPRPLTSSAGENIRVSDPSTGVVGHPNSTSSVSVRGSRVIVGFNNASNPEAGSAYGWSTDGGSTFLQNLLPGPGQNLGHPVVAFGPNGEIYYATLAIAGDGVSIISSCVSTDAAVSWTCTEASTNAGNVYDTQDKNWLAVDNSSSKYRGNVYVSWTDFSNVYGGSFILFARSTDGGLSFGGPHALSAIDGSQLVQDSSIAIGPNGEVFVSYFDGHLGGTGITSTKSLDGGVSFSTPKAAVLFTPIASTLTGGNGVRAASFPATAVDRNGTYHLVYAALSPGQTVDRSDIFYVRSTDGGITFRAPVRLNDDATATSQWSPSIAVTEDGRIAVKWWDRRNDPLNDSLTDVYMTVSADGGATFGRNIRVTDHNWVFGPSAFGSYHGDYDGLAGDSGNFHLSWSDERGADPDVYYTHVPSSVTAGPDFNVSARQVYASVRGGESATFDLVTSAANGFTGPLALSVSSALPPPSGLAYSFFAPSVAAGQPSQLAVRPTAATAPGTYLLTIAAAGAGSTRRTNVRLNVQPAARTASLPLDVSRSPGFSTLAGAPRIDSAGAIHVVYDDDTQNVTGDDVFYRRSTDRGFTWSTPVRVSTNSALAASGVLALDSAGNPYVAYTSQNGSTGEIWVARSTDRGATFQTPVRVSNASRNADLPAIAVDANRNVVVAFIDQDSANGLLVVNAVRSADGGATFGTIQPFAGENNINPIRPLSLAFDSKGTAYLAWSATGATFSCRMAIAAGGTTFSVKKAVSDASVDAFAPRVAVDRSDAVYLTFYNRYATATGLNREVMVQKSTDGGSTFSAPVNISNNDGQSVFPFVVPDARGGVSVVWQDDSGNDQGDAFYAHSVDGGKTFGAPVNLSANPGVSTNPAGAVDALGNLLLMWTDDSLANTEVFSAWAPTGDSAPAAAIAPLPGGNTFDAGAPVTFVANVTQLDPNDPTTVTWDFGDGTTVTSGPQTPVTHAYGAPGSYVVTLRVRDALGLVSTATLTVTVRAPAFAGGPEQLLPVVLDTGGAGGTHYTTELTLGSKAGVPVTVLLQYTASAGSGSGYARVTLAPGEQRVIPDAIAFLRSNFLAIPNDGSAQIGTLRLLFQGAASASDVFVGGRTSTPEDFGGTFGLFYTGARTSTTTATIFGLQQNLAQRSNLALVNAGPDPVTLRIQLQGPNGGTLSSPSDQTLAGFGWTQLNQPLLGQAESGRAVITRVSDAGSFTAYGVLNDAVTSDGSFIPPQIPGDTSGADRLIPVVLTTAGYQSELTLTNFSNQPMALTLTYTGSPQLSAAGSGSAPITLAAGEQRILPDSMAFLRNLGLSIPTNSSVGGSLLVRTPAGTPASDFAAGARTFTSVPFTADRVAGGGTFGLFYPGLTLGESATASATVNGLQQNASQRSNLAIVNRGDAADAIALKVTYYGADGAALSIPDTATLAPGEWKQFNQPLASRGATAGFAKVERLSGASRFVAYGVLNDQHNFDGSYIPMSR